MATASPDASLTSDESFVATSHRGLTYPFGRRTPQPGEAMTIAPGLGWARIALPGSLGHINIWLIDDADAAGGGVALVDTGMDLPACRESWAALDAGAMAGRRLTRVIGTHLHPDHIGLAGWLCRTHDVALWMTRGEWLTARMLTADQRDETPEEMVAFWRGAGWDDDQIAHAKARGWRQFGTVVTPLPLGYVRMRDGDVLDLGGRAWRVVVGSGHSPEHACLLNEVDGVLIAGDQVLPRISSNVSLSVTEPEGDPLGDWLASLAKLRELPGDLLVCPAHGEPFTGLHARLDALRDEHLARLDELYAYLDTPRRAIDCFGALFSRTIDQSVIGLATGETLAHLRRLEVEGRARRRTDNGVWSYERA
ncbi:MBL fold metallo-hydrolase [Sphingomonas sp. GlSt437]|uniref:MBL fold metallo-hydrolase n=1 Tax=Sphingomonas sp. GlSt437 TaxID=3389970 RepID=UPI003A897EAB